MSVFVKGLKMPKNCNSCYFNLSSLRCEITHSEIDRDFEYHGRLSGCPFVKIPKHHGDLIDRDALKTDIVRDWDGCTTPDDAYSWDCIHDAPVIIEAKGRRNESKRYLIFSSR